MENNIPHILILGLLMLTGLMAGRFATRFGLPHIVAYVAAGVLFSPALLGNTLGISVSNWSEPITMGALGIIAYLIGGSITIPQMRRMGKSIFSCAAGGALGAVLVVTVIIFPFAPEVGKSGAFQLALALGAIASTTAPAATIAVLHQYRAHGPLSSTLLGVVAVDDVLGIIIFSLMLAFAAGESLSSSLGPAFIEIIGSLLIGGILGILLAFAGRRIHQGGLRLPLILSNVFLVIGLADALHLSPLLSAMTLGFATRWLMKAGADRLFAPIDYFEEMVFVIFFTMAGAQFEANVFMNHFGLVLVYFFARVVGKVAGATLGAKFGKAPPSVQRYLGIAMLPQAGIAIGLALALGHHPAFSEISHILINVILAATLLNEVLGPIAVRFALIKAGELGIKRGKLKS